MGELTDCKVEEMQGQWERTRQQRLQELEAQRDASLKRIGSGHRSAHTTLQANLERAKLNLEQTAARNAAAMARHTEAMAEQAERLKAEAAPRLEMLERKSGVKEVEAQRSMAAVADLGRRMRERAAERLEEGRRDAAALAKGLPSTIDFKYSRLHGQGMPQMVEQHVNAGADGRGLPVEAAVMDETQRCWLPPCPSLCPCLPSRPLPMLASSLHPQAHRVDPPPPPPPWLHLYFASLKPACLCWIGPGRPSSSASQPAPLQQTKR